MMTQFIKRSQKVLGVTAFVVAMSGCQDLAVDNDNEPDRVRAITNPSDVEALIFGAWPTFMSRTHQSSSSVNSMPTIADEGTATYANNASLELSSEPRIPFNNNSLSSAHGIARWQWYDWYEGLSNANEGLIAINQGLTIEEDGVDNTLRAKAFAKFVQGLSLGYIGLQFDQGYIATENTDLSNPKNLTLEPYAAVVNAAADALEEAAAIASANQFAIDGVIEDVSLTNDLLAQLANTYAARILVFGARTPAERATVDWPRVLRLLDAGITEDFFSGASSGGTYSLYYWRSSNNGSYSQRADNRLLGPADISGAYQNWLATPAKDREKFQIVTPDRRITGDTPDSPGLYYEYLDHENFRPERGTYHFSYYQWNRYGSGIYDEVPIKLLSMDEIRLIRAEAAMHSGNRGLAAELINVTRTTNGQLPPLTADGVPQADDCAPRSDSGACASLEEALAYERLIEGQGLSCLRAFFERRGFGSLSPGTFLHFPIPARELETLGMPIYTWGGVGQPGSAS